jgi:hypothetical protein
MFVLKDAKTLVEMHPAHFASENDFQRLLADFPSLLAGDQIDSASPRRWVLVCREKTIPSEDGGSGRQTDTRIRREVVGQMLDYAANGVAYWPVEEIRSLFESGSADPDEAIGELVGPEGDVEAYWQKVKTNLQAGRIRMLFVADLIPPELRKIVEFLNKQMDPAEVLALELRQFEGQGLKTLVPMVYGQTQEAQQRKGSGAPKRQWDEATIFAELERKGGPEAVRVAKAISEWMKTNADRVWFGAGTQDGSMGCAFVHQGKDLYPVVLWASGKVEVTFQWIMRPPFDGDAKRREWLHRLNEIEGVNFAENAISRRPKILLSVLSDEARMKKFLGALDWFASQAREVPSP